MHIEQHRTFSVTKTRSALRRPHMRIPRLGQGLEVAHIQRYQRLGAGLARRRQVQPVIDRAAAHATAFGLGKGRHRLLAGEVHEFNEGQHAGFDQLDGQRF